MRISSSVWLQRYHMVFLGLLWISVQTTCWFYYKGPNLFGDGIAYLNYAQYAIDTGSFQSGHYLWYAGYALFIVLFLKLKLGLVGVALAQVLLSGLGVVAFYRTAYQLNQCYWPTAALVTGMFITWFSVQAFNPFILTESVFTSCLVLCLWEIIRPKTNKRWLVLVALLLYTAFLRPNGFIAAAAAILALLWKLWSVGRRRWAIAGFLLWLSAGVLELNQIIEPFHLLENYATGLVIYDYKLVTILSPANLQLPPASGWPIIRLGWFIAHNFRYFCYLSAVKSIYFLGFPRVWYSFLHSAWAFTVLPVVYMLAVLGISCYRVAAPIKVYLVTAILLQLTIVILTTEDWDARFSAPLIAYWLQLMAIGIHPFLKHRLSVV